MDKSVILIGYSGHAYVAHDCLISIGCTVAGYCEEQEKKNNPFSLLFLGSEKDRKVMKRLANHSYFVAIGNNEIRKKIHQFLSKALKVEPVNAVHSSAVISRSSEIRSGVLIAPNAVVNALVQIDEGAICNTSCIIEHECKVGKFSHIAPGATLCGNVIVGEGSFVGANSVVKEGVVIGKNVTIGAGTVVIRNIPDDASVAGNPSRFLKI